MEREQAVIVIGQILSSCGCGKSIKLLLQPQDKCSIQIEANDNQFLDVFQSRLKKIAEENGLTIKRNGTSFVISTP